MTASTDYAVNLTLRLSTVVPFARDTEAELAGITKADAIDNAIGGLPTVGYNGYEGLSIIEALEAAGFDVALPIDGEAVEL